MTLKSGQEELYKTSLIFRFVFKAIDK